MQSGVNCYHFDVLDRTYVNLVTGSCARTPPSHNATIIKQFLAQRNVTVLDHPPYSPDLAPADYFLFSKMKSHLKGRLFDSISDIQTAVTSTLNTTAKDDFYKDIQKLYDVQICVYSYKGSVSKTKQKSVISFTQILFIKPVLKLSRRTVCI